MLEYKPKDLLGSGLGAGDRARVGFNQGGGGRTIIGTCALPIQSGIKDQNLADWGENRMNAMELATAKLALGGLESGKAGAQALDEVAGAVQGNTGPAKLAVQQFFAGKMTGTTGLLKRTKGATINPNLELQPGQKLSTISQAKTIKAKSEIDEDYPLEIRIYYLNDF